MTAQLKVVVLTASMAWCMIAPAQQHKRILPLKSGLPFVEVLRSLEIRFGASFSYNHSLMKGLRVTGNKFPGTLDSSIHLLEALLPVHFESTGEKSYLLIPIRSNVNFRVFDASSKEVIELIHLKVNNTPWEHLLPKDSIYVLRDLFPTDSILIRSSFYKTLKVFAGQLTSTPGESSVLVQIYLEPENHQLAEVKIEAYLTQGIDASFSNHSLLVDIEELNLMAGETDGDVLNVLKTIPGISTPDGKPGSLNIRGSTFDQSSLYFDGIPIFHTGHFFGTISPYNPSSLGTVEIQRSAPEAEWGGRVGGLINISTKKEMPDSTEIGVQANTLYVGAHLNSQLKKDKLGVLLSMRSSHPFRVPSPKLDRFSELNFQGSKVAPFSIDDRSILEAFDIGFSDINGKLIFRPGKEHTLSFNFISINNDFLYDLNSPDRGLREMQSSTLDNHGASMTWNMAFTPKLKAGFIASRSAITIVESNQEFENGVLRASDLSNNQLQDSRLRTKLEYILSEKMVLETGYQVTHQHTALYEERDNIPKEQRPNKEAMMHGAFLTTTFSLASRLSINTGFRVDHYSPLTTLYVDPRIAMSYRLSKHVFLKASAGRAHQFLMQRVKKDFDDFRVANQFWLLADRNNPALEGLQTMTGALFEKKGWVIDLEFYSKITRGVSRETTQKTHLYGSMHTTGADLFLKKKFGKLTSWISYSLSHTETEFDTRTTAYFNQGHVFNAVALLNLGRWNFASSWGYLSGMPVNLPVLDPNHQNSEGLTELIIPYDRNFPAQHQLDLSATYKFWKNNGGWKGVLGLSALNVYNRQNIINIFQNTPKANNPYRYALGFAPNLHIGILL